MGGKVKEQLNCDILICGAGLAGLSLAYRALKKGIWQRERIIIVDPIVKRENDKTWSFWQKTSGDFDDLIYKSWPRLLVFSNSGEEIPLNTGSYCYHSIRSVDFYEHVLAYLTSLENVQFLNERIVTLTSDHDCCRADTEYHTIKSVFAFNSIYKKPKLTNTAQYFLQHFKGVVIESSEVTMNKDVAYLMDYRTSQEHGTTFFYTLPLGSGKLFVEYTLFSKSLLDQVSYDQAISTYIKDILKLKKYKITHTEFGIIPMTDHQFERKHGNIINIGTIGGDTRGATGYTFTNVQKTISRILSSWKASEKPLPIKEGINAKQRMYDAILLNVLDDERYKGHELFCDLFRNAPADYIFKFLDAESSLSEDLRIILSLKPLPFVKALVKVAYSKLMQ
ncbi:lycopene cyclase family protein [Pedobacter sp. SAFR-022]|uniref:lycopene cyclase family protein n=1 Tax=Pedobacter sp. SAFR-022 TaxID=3436861 RepID=UPI003F7F8CCD